jgi:hypothetical protein
VHQFVPDILTPQVIIHFGVFNNKCILVFRINDLGPCLTFVSDKKQSPVRSFFVLNLHFRNLGNLKKYFAKSAVLLHICTGMKQLNNKFWWWHTNSFGVL